ncbi:hypothetical protein [Sphingomonas sp. 3-13AW]|uniref:hypothetical protein n=1 Tax=Sphingomonas sp. 3-13AW TaxID=3050450 RepID=UPI003BB4FB20
MTQQPGDIITVPSVELEGVDRLAIAFGALGEERGMHERMLERRAIKVDMVSRVALFAHGDTNFETPILTVEVPAGGLDMGLLEDLCDVTIQHHARSRGEPPHAPHDAWDFRRELDTVQIRPAGGGSGDFE